MSRIEIEEILDEFNNNNSEEITVETIDALLKELEEIRENCAAINRRVDQTIAELDTISEEMDETMILVNDLAIKVKEELQ